MTFTFKKNVFLLVLLCSIIASCSRGPVVQDFAASASPTVEVDRLESDMHKAHKKQVNVLAPTNYEATENALADAKECLANNNSAKAVLHQVAIGRAYLKRANEFAERSRMNLKGVINARSQAIEARSPQIDSKEFKQVERKLQSVTADIEENDLSSAISERGSLQNDYLRVELSSIKHAILDQANANIAKAEKEGAGQYAQRTLALANQSVSDLDAYITANRHNKTEIAKRQIITERNTEHLLKITGESKAGKNISSEDMALKIEIEEKKTMDSRVRARRGEARNVKLVAINNNLEMEKEADLRFEKARNEFSSSEADVYKQGNKLTIRLKGLEFAQGDSELKSSNFALLAKVQNVIKALGNSSVVVQGHTDSTGGKMINRKLSSRRAQAVRKYLLSNTDDQALEVKAIGYDYQRPLATNKTAKGRAKNRRVDVVITAKNN